MQSIGNKLECDLLEIITETGEFNCEIIIRLIHKRNTIGGINNTGDQQH